MLRLPRRVWIQLAILAAVTLIAGGVMAFGFVECARVGRDRPLHRDARTSRVRRAVPDVRRDLPRHPRSAGSRRSTSPADGVQAELEAPVVDQDPVRRVGGGAQPVGRRRAVRRADAATAATARRGRSATATSSPSASTQIPPDIGSLLDATNRALQAIPQDNLQDRGRRSRQGGRADSALNCPASSTDRHRWRSMQVRTRTRSPS